MKNKKLLKFITVAFFLTFIFSVPIITFFSEDKKISEIENKILTQFPKLSLDNISSKRFMKNFDNYTSDQFPFRPSFIKLKNTYSYIIGQREFRNIYVGKDNRLMEKYNFNKKAIDENISNILSVSSYMYKTKNIKSKLMVVPTSIAFYKNDLPSFSISDNQKDSLDYIDKNILDKNYISFYTPYNVLDKNKNKYIYFNTDHHWTQLGAYISYLDMFNYKYNDKTLFNNYKKVSNDFYGTYYSKALLPMIKGDSIYSYSDFNNFKIEINFDETYNTLYDNSKLKGKNKYQYFLHGDPGFAVISGNKNKSNEIIVFKDSYAHSFIPFLTNNYGKIHVVDPRYYNIDLEDYLNENPNISDALFINNIQSFNSNFYKKFN